MKNVCRKVGKLDQGAGRGDAGTDQ
jgi:hypothetical protein